VLGLRLVARRHVLEDGRQDVAAELQSFDDTGLEIERGRDGISGPAVTGKCLHGAPKVHGREALAQQVFGERPHPVGAIRLGIHDQHRDDLESGGDAAPTASIARSDDELAIDVAHQWGLNQAHLADVGGELFIIGRVRLYPSRVVGILLECPRIDVSQLHGLSPWLLSTGPRG
jgi:hypothetical protein